MSRGYGYKDEMGWTREAAERTSEGREYITRMQRLLSEGVPIVLSSGNYADQAGRDVIDMMPQVLEKDSFPIINVGAATIEGRPWPKTQGQGSQDGTQLTIYAVGVDVKVHNHINGEDITDSGTSLAAPAVAGILAQHMKYSPWDQSKTRLARVQEIKRWLRTPESSWERMKSQKPDKPDFQVNMVGAMSLFRIEFAG
jgi:subtilisin family serine protease